MFSDEQLISEIKEYELLYNKAKGGYKNAKVKHEIWEKIASKIGSTSDVCIKRWRNLRDRFVKEYNKLQSPSGSSMEVEITWELYPYLTFLRDHVKPRKTTGTKPWNFEQEDSTAEAFSTTPEPENRKRKRQDSLSDLTEGFQTAIDNLQNFCNQSTGSAVQAMMGGIAMKIEQLPSEMQNNAMLEILENVVKLENFSNGLTNTLPNLKK